MKQWCPPSGHLCWFCRWMQMKQSLTCHTERAKPARQDPAESNLHFLSNYLESRPPPPPPPPPASLPLATPISPSVCLQWRPELGTTQPAIIMPADDGCMCDMPLLCGGWVGWVGGLVVVLRSRTCGFAHP